MKKVIILLPSGLVRPHLEYWIQFWEANFQDNIHEEDHVWRRVTMTVSVANTLKSRSYKDLMEKLKVELTDGRKIKADLRIIFNDLKGYQGEGKH